MYIDVRIMISVKTQIRFYPKGHTITKMIYNIKIDCTIEGSVSVCS